MMGQRKKINLIVEGSCKSCPYCNLSRYPYDFECNYENEKVFRIVCDFELDINNPEFKGWPPIPENCPLEDVDG